MPVIDGLASGLDTTAIIEGLLQIQQQRIDQLADRQRTIRIEQSAFAGIEGRLLSLRGSLSALTRTQRNSLSARVAVSSDESILTATATSRAATGVYTLTVNKLAQRHQLASNSFQSLNDEISQGTLTFNAGGKSAASVTIDTSNNTVQGLVDAINSTDAGVTASVVQGGTAGSPSYQIVLTSYRTGEDFGLSVTNNLGPSAGDAVQPTFDLEVQAAQNAEVSFGTGGVITAQSDTNQLDSLIPGVDIDLFSADPTRPITLTVTRDSEAATEAIQEFVDAYNDVISYIQEQSQFNAEANLAGPLLGKRPVIDIQNTLQTALTSSIAGLPRAANRLTALGVTVGDDGTLSFNSSRIERILDGTDPDVSADDLQRLFALGGSSTNSGISFVVGSSSTQSGTVQVEITAAAEQARLQAGTPLAATTVIDGSNNQLTMSLDGGEPVDVTLSAGTYTPQELAAEVQRAINSRQEFAGRGVSATVSNGALVLTSTAYGSSTEIALDSGSALSVLGFEAGATDIGQDVVGKFIVDGVEEKATGTGQLLAGDSDNEHTADLQVLVTLKNSQLVAGPEAELTVTRGLAAELDLTLEGFLDTVNGRVKTVNESYDKRVENIQASIDRVTAQFDARRESLIQQFVRLESSLSQLQTLGSYVGAQLSALPAIGR